MKFNQLRLALEKIGVRDSATTENATTPGQSASTPSSETKSEVAAVPGVSVRKRNR